MNRIVLLILFLPLLSNCSAQIRKKIPLVKEDVVIKDTLLVPIDINDYSLGEHNEQLGFEVVINNEGLYQFKDSTLVNTQVTIWLHNMLSRDTGPNTYGYLEGDIINGKKEGKWVKKIYNYNKKKYVTVKKYNYSKGALNGKYQVYNTKGDVLYPLEPHPLYPDEHKDYQIFKRGTGWYYDYYYEKEILKVKGYYIKSIKEGAWVYYDTNGNETHREYYKKGVLINQ